jgi:hypothetical protein
MPVHIENLATQVDAFEGELPLSRAQIERLVKLVIARIEEQQRVQRAREESSRIRAEATPTW